MVTSHLSLVQGPGDEANLISDLNGRHGRDQSIGVDQARKRVRCMWWPCGHGAPWSLPFAPRPSDMEPLDLPSLRSSTIRRGALWSSLRSSDGSTTVSLSITHLRAVHESFIHPAILRYASFCHSSSNSSRFNVQVYYTIFAWICVCLSS